MTSRKRQDGVPVILRQADATLEDWFRQSRVTTEQAGVLFRRCLKRAGKERKHMEMAVRKTTHRAVVKGAGVLRHQVDELQVGLEKLSAGLAKLERGRRPTPPRRQRQAVGAHSRTRQAKKAA